ncbi:hypothetical protein ACFL59_11900, partial [Planctomycetota bacterium]
RWDAETDLQPILTQGVTSAVVSLAMTPVFTPAVGGQLVGVEKVVTFSYGEQTAKLRLAGRLAEPSPVLSGFSPLEFDLVDFTGATASVAVTFTTSPDPGNERTVALAVGRTAGLETSAAGVRHVLVWNTRENLGVSRADVTLKLKPSTMVSGHPKDGDTTSVAVVVENDDRVAAVITSPQNGKVIDARTGASVPVEIVLVDSDQDEVDVRVEIDTGDARGFHLPAGFELTGVGTSETGTKHSLTYSPAADQLSAVQGDRRDVRLRVLPEEADSGQGIGHEVTFSLNLNAEPSVLVGGPTHDGQSIDLVEGVVEIGVDIQDEEGDTVTLITELSRDGGVTFEQPATAAVKDGRFSLDTPGAGLGLAGEQQVVVRVTPHDLLGGLSASEGLRDVLGKGPAVITIFTVDNLTKPPPTIAPETLSGVRKGKIACPYMLAHPFGYRCDVKVSYSLDGGEPREATAAEDAGGEPLTALLSSRAGIQHTFFWDTDQDMPTQAADRVVLTFEASDRTPAGVKTRVATGTLTLSIDNTVKSDLVFGQIAKSVDNRGVSGPGGIHGANGGLWVCDTENNRVLQYDSVPRFSYQGANLVLGQPDFVSTDAASALAGLTRPTAVFCDGVRLYVAEEQGRVLMWDRLPTGNGEAADRELSLPSPGGKPSGMVATVVGQEVYLYVADSVNGRIVRITWPLAGGSGSAEVVISGLDTPTDVKLREQPSLRFVVAEAATGRLLVWKKLPEAGDPWELAVTSNVPMEPAGIHLTENPKVYVANPKYGNLLLFQQEGDDVLKGDVSGVQLTPEVLGGSSEAVSDSSFGSDSPRGVMVLGNNLLVVDGARHRVMVFDGTVTSAQSFQAHAIIGQRDAHSGRANHATVDAFSLLRPAGLATDGDRLFVADSGNARVLVWQRLPEAPNRGADLALGQRDLHSAVTDHPSDPTHKKYLSGPEGVAVAGGSLFVADPRSQKILIWQTLPTRSGQPADRVLTDAAAGIGAVVALDYDPHQKILAAADVKNSRVLLWHGLDPATMSDNQAFQVALTEVTSDPDVEQTARLLDRPRGVRLVDGKLLVSDGNGRALVWNQVPATSTEAADVVLGRAQFSDIDRLDEVKRSPTREVISGFPAGLAMGLGRFLAVDQRANRVLIWNGIPKEQGAKADGLFGQRRMTLGEPNERGFSANSLFLFDEDHAEDVGFSPSGSVNVAAGLALSARHLWISDVHNNRLVRVPMVGEGEGLTGEGIAVQLAIEVGDGQTGVVATELSQELRVKVLDAFQKPVSGVFVSFVAREGGGVVTTASALSDSLGRVTTRLRLGESAGANRVEVLAPGTGLVPVTVQATALPGPAVKIVVATGDQQKGTVNLPLPEPLAVRVTDQFGNGIRDVRLQFAATPNSASVSRSEAQTNERGEASTLLTLGSTLGTNRVSVSAPDLPAIPAIELTAEAAVPGPAKGLAFTLSPPTSLKAGEAFSATMRIEDDAGNLVGLAQEITLSLVDPAGAGGALQGGGSATSTSGVATFAGLSVKKVGEGYYLLASSQGLLEAASKPFEVTPGQLTALGILEQPGDAGAGAPFGRQPAVELLDDFGNRATDAPVTAIRASVSSG